MKKRIFGFVIVLSFVFSGLSVYADDPAPIDQNPPVDPTPQENILIRDGSNVVYSGSINLPEAGTVSILDKNNVSHDVNTRSVLGVLYALDQLSDSFSVSNLQYYDSFGAFYLKCITPNNSSEDCDNWQYAVNGLTPSSSIDTTVLSGGENIGIYFGSPYQMVLDKNTITTNDNIVALAQKYNYLDNTWSARSGVTVGVIVPDPNNPWTPITISETAVDSNGSATLSFSNAGSYSVGIKEDYYFPSYPITVTNPVSSGGGGGITNPIFSISNANNFLESKQSPDGSFGDMLYTDWVAISSGASNSSFLLSVKNYLQNTIFNSNVVTDNERHAMALSAVGINPYTGTAVNYIKKITDSFDGIQIGDSNLINDDIFGLIILGKSGFTQNDDIISKDISYVISKQSTDGSWGSSVDMTAAGLQALRMYNVNADVTSRAENYLISNQNQSDGGFGNSFSTSWALQAIYPNSSMSSHSTSAENYLAIKQQSDGGMESIDSDIQNRIWSTSYAIPAVMHKTFSDSLNYFDKFIPTASSGGGSAPSDVKKEIKKDEVIVKKDIVVEKIPEITSEEIAPLSIKEVVKKPKINQISKNKQKVSQSNEISKLPDQSNKLNISASAANSGVSDRVYRFMGGVWGGISNVFKGFVSIFN
jgi:Prenyltransferase and squalene oxidase repeat